MQWSCVGTSGMAQKRGHSRFPRFQGGRVAKEVNPSHRTTGEMQPGSGSRFRNGQINHHRHLLIIHTRDLYDPKRGARGAGSCIVFSILLLISYNHMGLVSTTKRVYISNRPGASSLFRIAPHSSHLVSSRRVYILDERIHARVPLQLSCPLSEPGPSNILVSCASQGRPRPRERGKERMRGVYSPNDPSEPPRSGFPFPFPSS